MNMLLLSVNVLYILCGLDFVKCILFPFSFLSMKSNNSGNDANIVVPYVTLLASFTFSIVSPLMLECTLIMFVLCLLAILL